MSQPETPKSGAIDRRTVLRVAAWSAPVVGLALAAPAAAASNDAGNFTVTNYYPIPPNPLSASTEYYVRFVITPGAVPLPAGTLVTVDSVSTYNNWWFVNSLDFTYQNGSGSQPAGTTTTYLTAHDFSEPFEFQLRFNVARTATDWGARVILTLPAGWSAGPGALISSSVGTHF